MKQNWAQLVLKDVCTLQNGRAYKKKELLENGKYPVLRVGNFQGLCQELKVGHCKLEEWAGFLL